MSAARHNELATRFVNEVVRETKTHAELMVVVESTILASMLALEGAYGLGPRGCAEMVDAAVQAATERFVARGCRRP